MDIGANLARVKKNLPEGVKLIVVTKNQPVDRILQAYHAGHRLFGENRVQELMQKQQTLPSDIGWHLIGHLQSNKVKIAVPLVSLIHSVDSARLLRAINTESERTGRITSCLLEARIADEETKYGMSFNEIIELLGDPVIHQLKNIRLCGLMGMATFTDDQSQLSREFRSLSAFFSEVKNRYFSSDKNFSELSMGMSGDYKVAVQEGATMVRVGTAIFS